MLNKPILPRAEEHGVSLGFPLYWIRQVDAGCDYFFAKRRINLALDSYWGRLRARREAYQAANKTK